MTAESTNGAVPAPWTTQDGPVLIAEIGGNHEGDFGYAMELLELAIDAGADMVKFQIYYADDIVNRRESPDRHAHFGRFELRPDQHVALAERCVERGALYLASVWSVEPLSWIDDYLTLYKIGSGDLTAYPLLAEFAQRGKPIVLSTGLSTLDEVVDAVGFLRRTNALYDDAEQLAVLQCTSMYPIPKEDANLRAMATIEEATGATIGYSDHTTDSQALILATALGARVLEFHFTDSREGKTFRDHQVSLTPAELVALRANLEDVARLLGDGVKKPLPSETAAGHVESFRRSLYYRTDLPAGHVVGPADVVALRPAGGLDPRSDVSAIGPLQTDVAALDRVVAAQPEPG